MKHWLDRTPRTVGDWLGLALGTALIFGGVAQLPALAAALGQLAVMLRPFLWGLVLAYVLDIPTRWLAAKWFGGRRGAGAAVSYALLFGAAGLLLWLILPQLAQSVTSLFGKLAAYEETLRRLLAWVQATFGVDTATMDAILQQLTARMQSEFAAWSGRAAQAAAKAASNTAGAAADAGIALAASIYLLLGKEKLLHSVRLCLRAALPSRTVGQLGAVFQLADRTFSGYIGAADRRDGGRDQHRAGAGAVFGRSAGGAAVAAGVTPAGGRVPDYYPGRAADRRQLHRAAHFGRGHGAIRAGGAAGHRGGRRAVWHPRHGSRCAHAGRFGSAGTAGGGRRADGPRPARGTTARPAGKNCYKKGKKLTICLLHHAPICKYNKIDKPNGQ